ncbi:hypothetical protein Q73_13505 [Bacillus coahuilensis m2-6]|nr:hypothetical protein Q73_13505 [Bacillus coahuilensis m2-6]
MKQTYQNIEIIIVDDNGESEFSKDIVSALIRYPDIKYIAHKENKGACEARNTGIINSTGDYIAFLDDDDTWEDTKIEKQILKFTNPNVGLVYCGIKYFFEYNGKELCKTAVKSPNPIKDLLIHNFIGSTSCGIVKKSCAIEVGMFDNNLKSGQDLDFWCRIAEKYEIDCVEECLLNYTLYRNETITSNYNNRLLSNLYLKEKYFNRISQDRELLTVYNLKIVKAYLKLKGYKKAIKHMSLSFSKNEISIFYALKNLKL